MKKLQSNFTTPEQSKRLLELGVPADSADCVYIIYQKDSNEEYCTLHVPLPHQSPIIDFVEKGNVSYKNGNVEFCYSWSVGRLIEIYRLCDIIGSQWIIKGGCSEPLIECIITNIEYQIKNEEFDFSKLEE